VAASCGHSSGPSASVDSVTAALVGSVPLIPLNDPERPETAYELAEE
jgi:hypothetical protein